MSGFGAILADPPWHYRVWSAAGTGRSAERHYRVMSTEAICALPVARVAAADSVLFLWATWPLLPDALRVIDAWGFAYRTCSFAWVKLGRAQGNSFAPRLHIGMGHWTRANTEPCLLATRGRPRRLARDVRQVILSPVGRHSCKPDDQYERIERLVAGPYLELFARRQRPGWTALGDAISGRDIAIDLAALAGGDR